jgi:ABC-2 type transport system ATP-binding protein
MRAIVGTQVVVSGSVTVLGEPAGSSGLRHRVAYTTQSPAVYADLTVRENVRYFARLVGAAEAQADETVELVGLGDDAGSVVSRLSGGQRSRVSLATALVGRPELLVLDEPTVGLDPLLRRDLWQTFARLAAEGATLLVSSHVMDEAERCDELLLVRDGRLLARGTAAEIRARTGSETMDAAFLQLVTSEAVA